MSEDPKTLQVASLTTYKVGTDGAHVDINACDHEGVPMTMVMSTACITQLLMTLPRILQEALEVRSEDDSRRVVYGLDHWRMERGEQGPAGEQLYILTVGTEGGFRVSFASPADTLVDIARSIFGGLEHQEPTVERARRRLS